jgi:hypothetical protein
MQKTFDANWFRYGLIFVLVCFGFSALAGTIQEILHEAVMDISEVMVDKAGERITIRPPKPLKELIDWASRPQESSKWIPGYWRWDPEKGEFTWSSGIWREPPPEREWNEGTWEERDGAWQWSPGYWGEDEMDDVALMSQGPPPRRAEKPPSRSEEDRSWIAGDWEVEKGEYRWRPGHWAKHPKNDMEWVEGKWVKTGKGYKHISGYWDHPRSHRGFAVPPGHAKQQDPDYKRGKKKESDDRGRGKGQTKGRGNGQGTGKGKGK